MSSLILDDVWSAQHAELLNIVDPESESACVITTRIRNLAAGEVSCGLLSVEESLALFLKSAGFDHLVAHPPQAAIEAVECCGRLALTLPIAGGIARELEELWEAELIPTLKAELSESLSIEQCIVNASLRSIGAAHRAGVEALFTVFGCFAEDEVVPAVALDVLAPMVLARAGLTEAPRPHVKTRKWLSMLLNASLLSRSALDDGTEGASVHDLVRDVMIARAAASEGGMVALQREVLRLFLAAYNNAEALLRRFLVHAIRYHVASAQRTDIALREDSLLLRILRHEESMICVQAVRGLGLEALLREIRACETAGCWWEAVQLLWAVTTHEHRAAELIQARAALRHVPETDETLELESRIVSALLAVPSGGYAWGTDESNELVQRLHTLNQQMAATGAVVETYDAAYGKALAQLFDGMNPYGYTKNTRLCEVSATKEGLSTTLTALVMCSEKFQHASTLAKNEAQRNQCHETGSWPGLFYARINSLPQFKKEVFAGEGGRRLRENIQCYDYRAMHGELKSSMSTVDDFLFGGDQFGLLLWYGDKQTARAGLVKQVDARKRVAERIRGGEAQWSQYLCRGGKARTHTVAPPLTLCSS